LQLVAMASSHIYRIVVVGVGGVGKSCLTIQYIADRFIEEYDPTLEDSYRKQVRVDAEECILDIFDTAGQDDFSSIRDQYYRTGDGFLCVYAITLQSSFEDVREFHDAILRVKDVETIPFVLVGNKCDLEDERKISREEGQELANQLGCKFMEVSAKRRINVDEMFTELVREIMRFRKTQGVTSSSGAVPVLPKKKKCMLF